MVSTRTKQLQLFTNQALLQLPTTLLVVTPNQKTLRMLMLTTKAQLTQTLVKTNSAQVARRNSKTTNRAQIPKNSKNKLSQKERQSGALFSPPGSHQTDGPTAWR